jgi:hypothetical protein
MAALVAEINLNDVAFNRSNLKIEWKGKTFNQITSRIQMNTRAPTDNAEFFRAMPILLPRREIVTNYNSNSLCNYRASSSIDLFNMPNGSIINSSVTSNNNGLVNTMDNTLPNNTCEDPGTCLAFASPSENARRRVRSAGMIKRQFDISRGNDVGYFVNKNQYLVSRNRTFTQNQYNFIRQGDATIKPGDALSSQNLYSTQGLSHCPKYFLPTDCSFAYQWIDNNGNGVDVNGDPYYYTVDVSSGYYTIDDVNNKLHLVMDNNGHYFIDNSNKTKVFTIYFAFNIGYNKIELHTSKIDRNVYSSTNVSKPYLPGWDPTVYPPAVNAQNYVQWPVPDGTLGNSIVPVVKINNNAFTSVIGFSSGIYPTNIIPTYANRLSPTYTFKQNLTLVDNVFLSSSTPGIQPVYATVAYKPSNPQFASQGGVSASSKIARARYNAITNNTAVYNNAYGLSVANALAYGVPEGGYTFKDKLGYPTRSTPYFKPLSDVMICTTCNTWDPHTSTKAN